MKKTDVKQLIKKVEAFCEDEGIRFTEPRRHVLEIIASSETPLVAYDILAQLGKKLPNPKPPTAYRAIDFLTENGFIHRIESLNAFVICQTDHRHEGSQFLICDDCHKVTEAHLCHLPAPLSEKTKAEGFHMSRWNVELHGTCRDCARHAPPATGHHHH